MPPPRPARAQRWPTREHARKVLLLLGCVQPSMMPNINSATARVLDAAGIQTLVADERRLLRRDPPAPERPRRRARATCGATSTPGGRWCERGAVEAIVMNASGCGVTVKEYGHSLAHDPDYATKAGRIADLTRDVSELLPDLVPILRGRLALPCATEGAQSAPQEVRNAPCPRNGAVHDASPFHPPCTLQHGQRVRGVVETVARARSASTSRVATNEAHLCCGSAGTYSVLQPELANALRDRKLGHLAALAPATIVSANIGCIQHLQSGTTTPVRHWIEVLDDALAR